MVKHSEAAADSTAPRERPGSHQRPAMLPPDSAGRYSIAQGESRASTQPEMDAVPHVAMPRAPLGTSSTKPEMPAVRARGRSPVVRELPTYSEEEDDQITELTPRSTDYGTPPSLPAARDRSLLLRMDGAQAGQVVAVDHGCRIGRHADNDVAIDDHGVSRFHATVKRERDGFFITDAGSRNGTYVQGQRITRAQISDGDWIQLGPRVSFRFTQTDARQEKLLRQLFESSTRDALTGAYNRKHFDERLNIELAYAKRHATNTSLIVFDLDHFKHVNDEYGHLAGDAVLRGVSVTVNASLRAEDIFARYGGEEFAVILRGIGLEGATRAAERLRTAIAGAGIRFDGEPIPVTVSMGVASLECLGERTPTLLVAAADRRLYAAKAGGRNRVVAFG